MTAPNRATQLSLTYFLKSSVKEKCQRGGRRLMQYSVFEIAKLIYIDKDSLNGIF